MLLRRWQSPPLFFRKSYGAFVPECPFPVDNSVHPLGILRNEHPEVGVSEALACVHRVGEFRHGQRVNAHVLMATR